MPATVWAPVVLSPSNEAELVPSEGRGWLLCWGRVEHPDLRGRGPVSEVSTGDGGSERVAGG